jgi:hypothetical protein
MPIVGTAKKVLNSMIETHGKEKGTQIFYATANKQGRTPETWEKKASYLLASVIVHNKLQKHAASIGSTVKDLIGMKPVRMGVPALAGTAMLQKVLGGNKAPAAEPTPMSAEQIAERQAAMRSKLSQ